MKKELKEAYCYDVNNDGIICKLCPHECFLKSETKGICRARINYDNKLFTLAYNNPVALHIDPIEKKPLFHFLPGTETFSIATEGCNSRCLNCQNFSISQKSPSVNFNLKYSPENIVKVVEENNCKSISYTYTDPIAFYEYTYDISEIAKSKNIKNIIVSSGFINKKPLKHLTKYIDAANIDLKVFDKKLYKKLCGTNLDNVLDTLLVLQENNIWLEITNLIIPTWSDNLDLIRNMCSWLVKNNFEKTPIHFSRFSPLYKLSDLNSTKISTLEEAYKIAKGEGMEYIFIGNVWNIDSENTVCPKCGKTLIKRQGFRVIYNKINENICPECGYIINGIWN